MATSTPVTPPPGSTPATASAATPAVISTLYHDEMVTRGLPIRLEFGSEVVSIFVGEKRKLYTVHKKLLCFRSDYFLKAFNGGFKEAKGSMDLPTDSIVVFDLFLTYIYRDCLPVFPSACFPDSQVMILVGMLSELFVFAQKICMNELANRVMDRIQDVQLKANQLLGVYKVQFIYKNTAEDCKLRLYVAYTTAFSFTRTHASEKYATLIEATAKMFVVIPRFGVDVSRAIYMEQAKLRLDHDPRKRSTWDGFGPCKFHTHADGETCHLQK